MTRCAPLRKQGLSLSCSCGDTAYSIPPWQASDSAMWCTGALDLVLMDGTPALVYNPYSLAEVSAGVAPMLACLLKTSSSFDACSADGNSIAGLGDLLSQNVQPLAVWSRCKANFFSKTWDTGAGALYTPTPPSTATTLLQQRRAIPSNLDADVLACLADPSRLHVDYSACMQLSLGRDPRYGDADVYFQYTDSTGGVPDACIAFSGLSQGAVGPLKGVAQKCMLDPAVSDPDGVTTAGPCPLVAGIWTGEMPTKLPVTMQHGRLSRPGGDPNADPGYQAVLKEVAAAFDAFERSFPAQVEHLTAVIFSADGDVLHDTMDCIFQVPHCCSIVYPNVGGPLTRRCVGAVHVDARAAVRPRGHAGVPHLLAQQRWDARLPAVRLRRALFRPGAAVHLRQPAAPEPDQVLLPRLLPRLQRLGVAVGAHVADRTERERHARWVDRHAQLRVPG